MPFTKKNNFSCFAVSLFLILHTTLAHADSACRFVEQASLDISHSEQSPTPMVAGEINGKPVKLILDTGASQTYVLRAEADRQNLNPERMQFQTQGIGGLSSIFMVKIKKFAIGNAYVTNLRFPVLDALEHSDAAGLIGVDFLMQYDVELNLARNNVKLFRANDCQDRALAYWDRDASSVPMDWMDGSKHVRIQVKVNGVTLWALIDSGANRSVIDVEAARKLGFSTTAPGVKYSEKVEGIGTEHRDLWNMTFDSFVIGDEVIRHPRIAVMDEGGTNLGRKEHDMTLGRDFLNAHHVLLAQSQMLMYFSYNGGQVFPTYEQDAAKPQQAAP